MTSQFLNYLIAESEPPQAREKRRESVGKTSGDTYEALLAHIGPEASCTRIKPTDKGTELPAATALEQYDAVFVTGSPLHLYQDVPECRRIIEFMRAVFSSGTPSFGSCAGLQVASVAAGGAVRPMGDRREAGFARRIFPTEEGRNHPMLRGRPLAFDAPAIHTDEVAKLPAGATLLASNAVTGIQAAEIVRGEGVFWGVQYHPEINLREVAAALRRQSSDLVEHGLSQDADDVEQQAQLVDELHANPGRRDLAWRLGLDEQVTTPGLRSTEIRNFIERLVLPTSIRRGRG